MFLYGGASCVVVLKSGMLQTVGTQPYTDRDQSNVCG